MQYIKRDWKFYKEINLDSLSKEELVDLIKNAIEINPTIVEKRSSYPVYVEKYSRWKPTRQQPFLYNSNQQVFSVECSNKLNSMEINDLVALCKTEM